MIFFWAETPDGWGIPGLHGPLSEDEPTASLEKGDEEIFFRLLAQVKKSGGSILFVSHRLGEVPRVSDEIVVRKDAAARLGAAGPTLGQDLLLNTLAAIVVGGTSLAGGIGGVHRTLIGVAIIALLDNGLNLMGVNQYTQMVIKGAVVVVAVLIGQDRRKSIVIK